MNTTELANETRLLWLGPSTTELDTDDENILLHADRVIEDVVQPAVHEIFEEYLIAETRETLSSERKVEIPGRAFNGKVRKVEWRNSAASTHPVELKLINRNERTNYPQSGRPAAWYFEGDFIVLQGDPDGVLDVSFPFKPGSLVTSDNYRTIQSVDPVAGTITLTENAPTEWGTSNTFDIQDPNLSGMLRYWGISGTIAANVLTMSSEIAGTTFGRRLPEAGDYVCLQGKNARPMAPLQLHGTIAQGIVARIAQAQGDDSLWQIANAEFRAKLQQQVKNLDRRVDQPRVLINHNSRYRRWGNTGFGRGRRRLW